MSLVSDALRKARQEAAQREAERRGVVAPAQLAPPASGGRFGAGLILGAVIAVVAAGGGAAVVWWLLASGGSVSPPVDATATVDGDAAARVQALEPPGASSGIEEPEELEPSAQRVDGQEPGQRGAAVVSTAVAENRAAEHDASDPETDAPLVVPEDRPPPEPAIDASSEAGAEAVDGVREYVLDADLGYAQLSLGYVVFRSSDPYAEINGRLVHEGWRIEGFVVEEITANTVRLRDDRGELILRAR